VCFQSNVRLLRVALGTDRHIFTHGHRHRTSNQASHASDQDGTLRRRGRRDTNSAPTEPFDFAEPKLLTGILYAVGSDHKAVPLARQLKARILTDRRLTATIGIATNKLLAKIASDHQKPDGLTVITDHEKVAFLRPLPVRTLYGVGKVTEQTLNKAGIATVGDLQDYPGDLRALVGSPSPEGNQGEHRKMAGEFYI